MTRPHAVPALERLVVGVDFTQASIDGAKWIARHFAPEAELVLVHVIQRLPVSRFLEKRFPATDEVLETMRTGAEARLRELSASIARGLIWIEVRVGAPDEELVRAAADFDADLIALGRPETRGNGWGRIGTTAQRVLRQSPVPVLLVTGDPVDAPSRLVVAVDDSDLTDHVLAWGGSLGERFSADAVTMHVMSLSLFTGGSSFSDALVGGAPVSAGDRLPHEEAIHDAERWLGERIDRVTGSKRMTPLVVSGFVRPADAILEQARSHPGTLLVMGSKGAGAGAAHRFLYGSVAEGVLAAAGCPVLVIVPDAVRTPRSGTARRPLPSRGAGDADARVSR